MRKIIHCDADCFFVATEIRDDSELSGLPVAVGGDPSRRGVISTCNYEARAFGVRSALASAYAKQLCPQLIILPHNMAKYRHASQMMQKIFLDYCDQLEPLSLDEAYLDVSDSYQCLGSGTLIAKDIRRRIQKEVGITVSAGVAANKFLAKVASEWQKPDGLTVIEPWRAHRFLQGLPVRCLPGVGPSAAKKLQYRGIYTCKDLQALDKKALCDCFGKLGSRLYEFSRGEDRRLVKAREYRKSLSVEHTFSKDLPNLDHCYPFLPVLADKIRARLLKVNEQQHIKKCFIKVKFSDFSATTMEAPSHEFSLDICHDLLQQAWYRHQKPARLLGLGVQFSEPHAQLNQQINLL